VASHYLRWPKPRKVVPVCVGHYEARDQHRPWQRSGVVEPVQLDAVLFLVSDLVHRVARRCETFSENTGHDISRLNGHLYSRSFLPAVICRAIHSLTVHYVRLLAMKEKLPHARP